MGQSEAIPELHFCIINDEQGRNWVVPSLISGDRRIVSDCSLQIICDYGRIEIQITQFSIVSLTELTETRLECLYLNSSFTCIQEPNRI